MGLHEDRPEHVHVLALARPDVVVQDVDASLCTHHTNNKKKNSPCIRYQQGSENRRNTARVIAAIGDVLLRCTALARHQSLRSGESTARSHPMPSLGRLLHLIPLISRETEP